VFARSQLLAYARKVAGEVEGEDLLQQAMLDAHDAVQARGISGNLESDYRFFMLTIIKRRWVDEQRRAGRLAPLPDSVEEWAGEVEADPRAHLAEQVAKFVAEEAAPEDRLALRLSAEGYSTREIEKLTGRPNRTVARGIERLKLFVKANFSQSWEGI
jgi:DNA-directed RNA polymerase specialized sigma24 family protein